MALDFTAAWSLLSPCGSLQATQQVFYIDWVGNGSLPTRVYEIRLSKATLISVTLEFYDPSPETNKQKILNKTCRSGFLGARRKHLMLDSKNTSLH